MKIIESSSMRFVAQEPNIGNVYIAGAFGFAGILILFKSFLFGLLCIAIGALVYVFRKVLTLRLDKETGKASLITQSIIKNSASETEISQIVSVRLFTQSRLEQSRDDQGNLTTQNERETSLLLLLKNEQTVDLSDTYQTNRPLLFAGSATTQPNQSIGQAIATFLGVPFENAVPGQFAQSFAPQATSSQEIMPGPVIPITPPAIPAVYESSNQTGKTNEENNV